MKNYALVEFEDGSEFTAKQAAYAFVGGMLAHVALKHGTKAAKRGWRNYREYRQMKKDNETLHQFVKDYNNN